MPRRIISSDTHVFEPRELWTERVEKRFRERAPRVERRDEVDWWVVDERPIMSTTGGSLTGARFDHPEKLSNLDVFENVRLGGYIPEHTVQDLDLDGVDVAIVYPTVCLVLYSVEDGELVDELFRAYNDWLAEFCGAFPKRLKGIGVLNLDDVDVGVRELERCAELGLVGALISVSPPEERAYDAAVYEPLWAAAQSLRMPLGMHISTNRPGPGRYWSPHYLKPATRTNADHWVRQSLGDMIYSGVFERYPELLVGSVEMELAWAAHFVERMDFVYTQTARQRCPYRFKGGAVPSDFFHRNVFMAFQQDDIGIRLRDIIGIDGLLWGNDYPHPESTFPQTQRILEEILADCTDEEKDQIVAGNAARIYGLD